MKGTLGFLIGAVLLAIVGGVCLTAAMLDRDMLRAEQDINTLTYFANLAPHLITSDPVLALRQKMFGNLRGLDAGLQT